MNLFLKLFTLLFLSGNFISILHAGEMPIQIEERIILVKGSINGSEPKTLIVDTGATETIITPPVAKALGIKGLPISPDEQRGTARSITVGDVVVNNLPVFIMDPPQALSLRLDNGIDYHGILGYTFLSHFMITLDYQKKTLTLTPFDKKNPPPAASKEFPPTQFQIVENHIHIKGWIDKKGPFDFLFDTGSSETIVIPSVARRAGLKGKPLKSPSNAEYLDAASILVGNSLVQKSSVLIYSPPHAAAYGINYEGILGHSFLSQFRVTIDYQNKLLTLVPYSSNR